MHNLSSINIICEYDNLAKHKSTPMSTHQGKHPIEIHGFQIDPVTTSDETVAF